MLCALELIDAARLNPLHPDYRVIVAEHEGQLSGYVCFGPTPMTVGTFDMYWIATDPSVRGKGVGRALVQAMEAALRERGAKRVRVETSASDGYGATRDFYQRTQFLEEARLRDFYRDGDDLIILMKRL